MELVRISAINSININTVNSLVTPNTLSTSNHSNFMASKYYQALGLPGHQPYPLGSYLLGYISQVPPKPANGNTRISYRSNPSNQHSSILETKTVAI